MSSAKVEKVLSALQAVDSLSWYEMPDAVGFSTLHSMEKRGLIEQVANGASPHSMKARWRLKPRDERAKAMPAQAPHHRP